VTGTWTTSPPVVVDPAHLPPQPPPDRVKVLHVITRFWAGAGGNTLLTALGTDPEQFEVWVAGCPGGDLWPRAREAGLRCEEVRGFREVLGPSDVLVLWRLVRLMRRERFTVVHTHSAKGGFLGRLAARMTHTPVVVHTFHGFSVHDGLSRPRHFLYSLLERSVRPFTDAFLAVSPRVAAESVQRRFARPGSVEVAPSAVELDDVPYDGARGALERVGITGSGPVVGTVGRIDYQKSPSDFVRMAARVAAVRPDVRFVAIGDGPMASDVRRLAGELSVPLTVTGYRSDAPALAAAMDVFVITSRYEGLGRALTEALASARPVVATAVNGVPDLVEPGATGLLAAHGDVEALAACVLWLLDNPDPARAMGRAGRDRVRAGFSADVMCAAVEGCYRRLLGLPEPAAPAPSSDGRVISLPEQSATAGHPTHVLLDTGTVAGAR
jgi:glycosyltransferase involved in cell wall biosynthesis